VHREGRGGLCHYGLNAFIEGESARDERHGVLGLREREASKAVKEASKVV
jgi:hypothetical protein